MRIRPSFSLGLISIEEVLCQAFVSLFSGNSSCQTKSNCVVLEQTGVLVTPSQEHTQAMTIEALHVGLSASCGAQVAQASSAHISLPKSSLKIQTTPSAVTHSRGRRAHGHTSLCASGSMTSEHRTASWRYLLMELRSSGMVG